MEPEGFLMSMDVAHSFFELCQKLGLDEYEDRVTLLRIMVKEKRVKYLRDPNEYMKDKRVLQIKSKKDIPNA